LRNILEGERLNNIEYRNYFKDIYFPVQGGTEDNFDKYMSESLKHENIKSILKALISERACIKEEELERRIHPNNSYDIILVEIINKGGSILHQEAYNQLEKICDVIVFERNKDIIETMGVVNQKIGHEIARSHEKTIGISDKIFQNTDVSKETAEAFDKQIREIKENTISKVDKYKHGNSNTDHSDLSISTSAEANFSLLALPNISVSAGINSKLSTALGTTEEFENSTKLDVKKVEDIAFTTSIKQSKTKREVTGQESERTLMTVKRGININVADDIISLLCGRELERRNKAKNALEGFYRSIEIANLVFITKRLIKTERILSLEFNAALEDSEGFEAVRKFEMEGDKYAAKADEDNLQLAVDCYKESLKLRNKFLERQLESQIQAIKELKISNDYASAIIHRKLGSTYFYLNRFEKTEEHYLESVKIHDKLFGKREPTLAFDIYFDLGCFNFKTKKR
jgi:tetratricopeptide (TPR) repeat protein